MHLLVCGDREWGSSEDYDLVFLALDLLKVGLDSEQIQLTIIEGECRGVDTIAREWAIKRQVNYLPFPANWDQGLGAGPQRNQKMLDDGKPDLVFAFHDNLNQSKGTKNMVSLAKKKKVPVVIYSRNDLRALQKQSS